ncbi:hypothetical protein ACF07Y_35645 [Streptomyces sp. NPDC016566]|uniref:hypothetical protein n=1 Tax=Streptomyces sp. NPDC016566 TaxID=3364967 RepID=UPI0036F6CE60
MRGTFQDPTASRLLMLFEYSSTACWAPSDARPARRPPSPASSVFCCTKTDAGANMYDPNPKEAPAPA